MFSIRRISTCRILLKRDLYEILSVPKTASASEIKKQYYQLAKQFHPDTNKDPKAKEQFVEIQDAYQILSDDQKRAQYDQYGHADEAAHGGPSGGGGFGDFGGFNGQPGGDFFNDIFRQFQGRQQTRQHYQQSGDDIELRMSIDFMDAVKGVEKKFDANVICKCPTCSGSGAKPGSKPKRCESCGGTGQVISFNLDYFCSRWVPTC